MRILIFIVAYNAEHTIESVLGRIPKSLSAHQTEVLIIDDTSVDATTKRANKFKADSNFPFPITVFSNPVNQGYGGNQKLGFLYAIQQNFDFVALLHGDGQYAPEALPDLLQPLIDDRADAVFGSRMMSVFGSLKGGMPLYKYLGNRILTIYQNALLGTCLSEFHSGYRIYSVKALRAIPFHLNTNVFHFDTQIIIQLLFAGMRIREISIPTYYGNEICRVDGIKYAWDVAITTLLAALQKYSLIYRRYLDIQNEDEIPSEIYQPKFGYASTHSEALNRIKTGSTVVDIGCASGFFGRYLKEKLCRVIGIDKFPLRVQEGYDQFLQHDLNDINLPEAIQQADYVLLLDVIEHLQNPEKFAESLKNHCKLGTKLIITTGNIGFIIPRLMLLFGQFNYGKRGILDLTHTRLFTFQSFEQLLRESGFQILEKKGLPAPFPLALKSESLSKFMLNLNYFLIQLSEGLFSYQIFIVAEPLPTIEHLLEETKRHSLALDSRAALI